MKLDTIQSVIPVFGKLVGMTTEEMEKVISDIKLLMEHDISDGSNPFADIQIAADPYDKEAMFVGAAFYGYILSMLVDK